MIMKHRELTDHIKGSFLKQQYLEAFLVQGAYIESLLKMFADLNFRSATRMHTVKGHDVIAAARRQLTEMGLYKLIIFIKEAGLISKEQSDQLDKYRERRNQIIHDLIKELKKEEFDAELKKVCEQGSKIIESDKFSKMGEILDQMESQNLADEGTSHSESNKSIVEKNTGRKQKTVRRAHVKTNIDKTK